MGDYAKNLSRRLRGSSKTAKPVTRYPMHMAQPIHPMRYPKHTDPTKGQVHGGECNVTRCSNQGAVFYNQGTYGLYCVHCARGINDANNHPLCILVDAKPTLKQMMDLRAPVSRR